MPKESKSAPKPVSKKKELTKPRHKPNEEEDAKLMDEVIKERAPTKKKPQLKDDTSSESPSEAAKPPMKKVKKEAPAPRARASLDINSSNILGLLSEAQPAVERSAPGGSTAPIALDSDSDLDSSGPAGGVDGLYDSIHVWFCSLILLPY